MYVICRLIFVSLLLGLASCSGDKSVSSLSSLNTLEGDDGQIVDVAPIDDTGEEINRIVDNGNDPSSDQPNDDKVSDDSDSANNSDSTNNSEDSASDEDSSNSDSEDEANNDQTDNQSDDSSTDSTDDPNQCMMRDSLTVSKIDGSGKLDSIKAFNGFLPSDVNYNYYSWSAHPIIGPAPKDYEGHFFFYHGPKGLSLNFFYNVDAGGSPDNQVKMDIEVLGNESVDSVLLSDDRSEVKKIESGDEKVNKYEARLHYWHNTDGAVIGPFKGKDLKIKIKIYNIGDNKSVAFHSSDGRAIELKSAMSTPEAYSEFEVSYIGQYEDCSVSVAENEQIKSCVVNVFESMKEMHKGFDWHSEWLTAQKDRLEKIKKLANEQKNQRQEIADKYLNYYKEAIHHRNSVNKEMQENFIAKLKEISKENKIEFIKEFNENKKEILSQLLEKAKEILAKRKSILADLNKKHLSERQGLAAKLLNVMKAKRAHILKTEEMVKYSLSEKVNSCYKD